MALVDTQGLELAVDRSLFGPQGRRWIERKLPEVAIKLSFIAVSAFGAVLLMIQLCLDYHQLGIWAIFQSPKHLVNASALHVISRLLRWHNNRMILRSYISGDAGLHNFFGRDLRGDAEETSVPYPWHQSTTSSNTSKWADSSKNGNFQLKSRGGGVKGGDSDGWGSDAAPADYNLPPNISDHRHRRRNSQGGGGVSAGAGENSEETKALPSMVSKALGVTPSFMVADPEGVEEMLQGSQDESP
ncbi:unnamed protein product, partial [Choristocarpus tenellus]